MKFKKLVKMLLSAAMILAMSACSSASSESSVATVEQTSEEKSEEIVESAVEFDGQYDVVVVGFGGAGATAAIAAAKEGANVLIVEKAPEESAGGNTRYSGQMYIYGNGNYENTVAYLKALAADKEVDEEVLETFASHVANLSDEIAEFYDGVDKSKFTNANDFPTTPNMSPEYPELAGAESISLMATHDEGASDGHFWSVMKQNILNNNEHIDVWYSSPATRLIQDETTKAVIGVEVERNGETVSVYAKNGVVMACGGYENNREMLKENLGLAESSYMGTEYNTGDGFAMVEEVGAALKNMDVYEGMGGALAATTPAIEGRVIYYTSYLAPTKTGAVILVDGEGNRFVNETQSLRHGHMPNEEGIWENPEYPDSMYLILTATQYQTGLAYKVAVPAQDSGVVWYGATIEDLAAEIGTANLVSTVESFNSYVENGEDADFARSVETMAAVEDENGYYAVKMVPVMLNTQGGPVKNKNAEVLDTEGNVIPHLYVAGEFGGMTVCQYQGGTNIADCVVWGRIAGTNAAQEKTDYTASESSLATVKYTIGVETDIQVKDYSNIELSENQYLGVSANGMGGDVVVRVTYEEETIKSIDVVVQNETPEKYAPVEEKLIPAIVEANSTEVDAISGSTISSEAIKEAVNNAIAQAK